MLGAFARYPAQRYLLAFALGRIPKFWLLATLGHTASAVDIRVARAQTPG